MVKKKEKNGVLHPLFLLVKWENPHVFSVLVG